VASKIFVNGEGSVHIPQRSLKLGHVSTSTRPNATALPGSRVSGALILDRPV
jgi:hypothetical protein